MTSLSPAFLESHLLYLTRRLLKGQSKCVLSKLIANTTGSVLCQFHVDQTLYMYMSWLYVHACTYGMYCTLYHDWRQELVDANLWSNTKQCAALMQASRPQNECGNDHSLHYWRSCTQLSALSMNERMASRDPRVCVDTAEKQIRTPSTSRPNEAAEIDQASGNEPDVEDADSRRTPPWRDDRGLHR